MKLAFPRFLQDKSISKKNYLLLYSVHCCTVNPFSWWLRKNKAEKLQRKRQLIWRAIKVQECELIFLIIFLLFRVFPIFLEFVCFCLKFDEFKFDCIGKEETDLLFTVKLKNSKNSPKILVSYKILVKINV